MTAYSYCRELVAHTKEYCSEKAPGVAATTLRKLFQYQLDNFAFQWTLVFQHPGCQMLLKKELRLDKTFSEMSRESGSVHLRHSVCQDT